MPKMVPKIILEGTRLTHKTDLAFLLNEHTRIVGPRKYRYHSPIISAEWGSFLNQPWGEGPINFRPEQEALAIETYMTWARMFELQRYYSWIVDRFHISTRLYQRMNHGKDYDFLWLEQRLAPLGFVVVLCTRQEESFEAAKVERLKISGNPSQYDDLTIFIREQRMIREIASESILPVLEVDISDDDVDRAAGAVADWMESAGKLYMKD